MMHPHLPLSRLRPLLLAAMCLVTLAVYWQGLKGAFVFDDAVNIVKNDRLHIHSLSPATLEAVVASGHSGPLGRPVSMLSFALNYYFTGLDPFYFKLTNLAAHLAAGVALFFLTWQILGVYRERHQPGLTEARITTVCAAVTAAWLLHPMNVTAVLYVVQRMTSLAALFTLLGLTCYMVGRRRMNRGDPGAGLVLTGLVVFTPLAALSKETGALLPLYMLVLELSLFGFDAPRGDQRRLLRGMFAVAVGLPAAAAAVYAAVHPQWILNGYAIRDFDLGQRLLTEARALWFYIRLTLAPTADQLGLFHDDFGVSKGLLSPVTTLWSVIGLILLAAAAYAARRRAPLLLMGILWFFAGQALESSVFPLELVFEHRNYLPMYGILLPAAYYLLHPALGQMLTLRHGMAVLFVILLITGTAVRAGDWGSPGVMAIMEAYHHPESPRANHVAGDIFATLADQARTPAAKDKYYRRSLAYYQKSGRLGGNDLDGMFGALLLQNIFDGSVDTGLARALATKLRDRPFAASSANQFLGLIKCEENRTCRLPPAVVDRLFHAALDNPTLKGIPRTVVLTAAAEHLANTTGDLPDALKLLRQGVQLVPDHLATRMSYINILIAARDYDQARRQLTVAARLDKWHAFDGLIAADRQALERVGGSSGQRTPASAVSPGGAPTPAPTQARPPT